MVVKLVRVLVDALVVVWVVYSVVMSGLCSVDELVVCGIIR